MSTTNRKQHWEAVYETKAPDQVSWYRPHLDRSLRFLDLASLSLDAEIIDVGGGTSTFVDDLLDRRFTRVTVLDLSAAALQTARLRLGPRAGEVLWLCADVLEAELPPNTFDFWHDRAVFHFLTTEAARARYVEVVRKAVKPGGHVVIATFGPNGPQKCSGLDVSRFTSEGIHAEFGRQFQKVGEDTELHDTPWGSQQEFVYCYCRVTER